MLEQIKNHFSWNIAKKVIFISLIVFTIAFAGLSYGGFFDANKRNPTSVWELFDEESQTAYSPEKYDDIKVDNFPEFSVATQEAGLNTMWIKNTGKYQSLGVSNSGVYAQDYNKDGYTDLLVLGTNPSLYKNKHGTFVKVGLFSSYSGNPTKLKSAHFLDFDNDNDDDLFIARVDRKPILYENTKQGWERKPPIGGGIVLTNPVAITSADYNNDGCIDIYIGNYGTSRPRSQQKQMGIATGDIPQHRSDETLVGGGYNKLFKGNCRGGFKPYVIDRDVKRKSMTLAVSFVDINNDGLPDIHSANDFSQDVIYINQGNGEFKARMLGVETARNGMSSEVTDFNNDGRPDIFVTNIYVGNITDNLQRFFGTHYINSGKGNNVLINKDNATFAYKGHELGVNQGGWGWSTTIDDFNNDGYRDIIHATASQIPAEKYRKNHFAFPQIWTGTGNKTNQFKDVPARAIGFHPTNGRGIARLDYNRDGALDVVIASSPTTLASEIDLRKGKTLYLYKNTMETEDDFVQIQLSYENKLETGAKIHLYTTQGLRNYTINSKSGFLSQEPQIAHYGLYKNEQIQKVVVSINGKTITYKGISKGHYYLLTSSGIKEERKL